MAYMTQAFIAIAVIAVVAIAAVSYQPKNPLAPWLKLAERYATDRRPSQVMFARQQVFFSEGRSGLKTLGEFASFDATIDDFGLWLIYTGGEPEDVPPAVKIPGTHVRYQQQKGSQYVFELYAEPPVTIAVRGDFGDELMRRCQP